MTIVPTVPVSELKWSSEKIMHIKRWTDVVWSVRISRPPNFAYRPGHYARLGLPKDGDEVVWRPFSMVSAPREDFLEFLLVLIPHGAFSTRMAALKEGDAIQVERLPYGFFLHDQLAAGRSLWMLATGTGLGPYISMLRDKSVATAHDKIILTHSVRKTEELAYRDEVADLQKVHGERLVYLPVVTREPAAGVLTERIPTLIRNETLQRAAGVEMTAETARVMVCGNPEFTAEMRKLLKDAAFVPCRRGAQGSMLFENYWS